MRTLRGTVLVVMAAGPAAACGGGADAVVHDAAIDAVPARYDSPDDFDRAGCVPGSFAGYPPQGIYQFTRPGVTGLWTSGWPGVARLDVAGDGGVSGVLYGHDTVRASATADDLFWHALSEDGSRSYSLDLCAQEDGAVRGRYAFCNAQECYTSQAIGVKLVRRVEAAAQGLTLLGELPPPSDDGVHDVAVDGDLAYLACASEGLRVVDVSDPTHPVEIGRGLVQYPNSYEYYNDVRLYQAGGRRYALMGSNRVGVAVWDVTTPSAPDRAGSFGAVGPPDPAEDPPNVHTLFIDGSRAFLAHYGRGLQIWDIANPRAPRALHTPGGNVTENVFPHDLYVSGNRAYVSSWAAGMMVIDVANLAVPTVLGVFVGYGESSSHSVWVTQVGARRIAAHGDEQWGAHLRLVDVTEATPGFMTQVGEWQSRPEVSIHNVVAAGSEVFIAHYQDGVRILDISDPSRPVQTAWFNTWPGYDPRYGTSFFEGAYAIELDPARGRLYVADSHRGLLILQRTP